jgi:hypothetical protein
VAWNVVEGLYRQRASELGPKGVRLAWLRTGGFVESILGRAAYESVYMFADGSPVPLSELVGDESAEQKLKRWSARRCSSECRRWPKRARPRPFSPVDHAKSITARGDQPHERGGRRLEA